MARIFAGNERKAAMSAIRHSLFPDSAPKVRTGCSGTREKDDPPDVVLSAEENTGAALAFVGLEDGDVRLLVGDQILCDGDNPIAQYEWCDVSVSSGQPVTVTGTGSFEIRFAADEN